MIALDLSDHPVFMTGALGGIGRYVVRTLARAGAPLYLTDLCSPTKARAILVELGLPPEPAWYRSMDVTDEAAVEAAFREAADARPDLATVIGLAGGCEIHPFAKTSSHEFARIMQFNFISQTYLARTVLRYWTDHRIPGHLVLTSSYVAQTPHSRISAYVSAKAALEAFGKAMALEYGSQQIRVNLFSPGNVAVGSSLKVYDSDEQYRAFCDRVSPLGRRNTPQRVADALLFLISPLAGEINGHVLAVDTGISIPKIE